MNVKQGDLAYTVAPYAIQGRGRFVTVIRLWSGGIYGDFMPVHGIPCWLCEGDILTEGGDKYRTAIISDDCLRPIGKPGDEEVDQTITWAPVPSKLKEKA